jgi:hypothetical protein
MRRRQKNESRENNTYDHWLLHFFSSAVLPQCATMQLKDTAPGFQRRDFLRQVRKVLRYVRHRTEMQ